MAAKTITVADIKQTDFIRIKNADNEITAIIAPNDMQIGTRTLSANLHVSGVLSVGSGTIRVTSNDIKFGNSARIELASSGLKFFDVSNPSGASLGGGGGGGGSVISTATPSPLGTATPGTTGEVSDAGHVHAMPSAAAVGADASGAAASAQVAAEATAASALSSHAAGVGHPAILTSAGDIAYHDGTLPTRLPVGLHDQILRVDTSLAGKLIWTYALFAIGIASFDLMDAELIVSIGNPTSYVGAAMT